ncbi:MAG: hypothetical protein RLO04_03845 [Limnobacter sp.]
MIQQSRNQIGVCGQQHGTTFIKQGKGITKTASTVRRLRHRTFGIHNVMRIDLLLGLGKMQPHQTVVPVVRKVACGNFTRMHLPLIVKRTKRIA